MYKKLGLILSFVAALAVIVVGTYGFACDGSSCKTAKAKTASAANSNCAGCPNDCSKMTAAEKAACQAGKCPHSAGAQKAVNSGVSHEVMLAGSGKGGCCSSKKAGASSCGSGSSMTSVYGSKGYYAANVYEVRDGHTWAIEQGRKFEVTLGSPFIQVGNARYYFESDESKKAYSEKMSSLAPQIDREVVSLATTEANVVGSENGQKIAECKVSGKKFPVTADSPMLVMDGQKTYFCGQGCCNTAKGI
jgi:hypothetical protein